MSRSLRAVKTTWFEHSSLFVDDIERLPEILEAVMDESFEYVLAPVYDDMLELFTSEGDALLDRLEGLTDERIAEICEQFQQEHEAVRNLLGNLRNLAGTWRGALETGGEESILRIWIDAC